MSNGFNEESSTERREIRQAKIDAIENYKDEQIQEEDERFFGEVSNGLDELLNDMSGFAEFENKLDRVNGVLVEEDLQYIFYGDFDTDMEISDLENIKGRADRFYNDAKGTKMETVATAFRDTVDSVNLNYGDQLL